MSSSDDRRRPRVAGHRRRPRAVEPTSTLDTTTPVVEDDAAPVEVDEAPAAAAPGAEDTTATEVAPDTGTDAGDDTDELDGDAAPTAPHPRRGAPRPFLAPLVALGLALLLLAAVAAVSLGDPGAKDRDARAATAAARADLEQLLSYDHQTLERQASANVALLTGSFKDEYATTMAETILPLAQEEKAVVRARSYEAGVMAQTDDTVTVQVFLNQAKTSEKQEQPSVDQNRVIATMQRVGDRWLIAKLVAY